MENKRKNTFAYIISVKKLILSLFVIFAVCSSEVLITGAESDSAVLNFLSKLANTVFTINTTDILSL